MRTTPRRPKWWQVYTLLPLLVGLYWPEMKAPLTETGHVVAELGILFLIFGFMQFWLRSNKSALMASDPYEVGWGIKYHEITAASLHANQDGEQSTSEPPIFRLPPAAIKGVLADTFEWDAREDQASQFADRSAVAQRE